MTTWQNRIVRTGELSLDEAQFNPKNWRIHPKVQQDALAGVLAEVGIVQQVIVNERTGNLIDGHLRVTLADRNGETAVPAVFVDLSEDEEALVLATLDPIGAMAATDSEQLDALLDSLAPGEGALADLLASLRPETPSVPREDPGPQVDRADELRQTWGTERGQLWAIGRHRLHCGDSTSGDDVGRLMGGELAVFSFTDPPYNVGVAIGDATNDDRSLDDFCDWCQGWLAHLPARFCMTVGIKRLCWWDTIAGEPTWIIAWVKRNGQGNTKLGGTNKWDAILVYGCEADGGIDVLEVNNDYSEGLTSHGQHPTPKPVALCAAVLERFSQREDLVYEPFAGSGTTLVAAEQTGRICYGMEIEPKYVAVALERLAGMGLEPRLVD